MHPEDIRIIEYNYPLPEGQIAKYPLSERDASRLLVYENGSIREDVYKHLADYLPSGSRMFFNNSKVVEARIIFQKLTGAFIELFCLEPHEQYADPHLAMQQQGRVWWNCMIGGASKWKKGQILSKQLDGDQPVLHAKFLEKKKDEFLIEFSWIPEQLTFAEILHQAGQVPLPPYLHREAEALDTERYQTIYAVREGSVAAPTAGLHFSPFIFEALASKNIQSEYLTLHVGAGTFKPVKSETLALHAMHQEFIEVPLETIIRMTEKKEGLRIAVGTTSLRTLETLYWLGLKVLNSPDMMEDQLVLHQWEPYHQSAAPVTFEKALEGLAVWLRRRRLKRLMARTELLIAPGYIFRGADVLITNFHQPQSTLLLLIAAFIGEDWKRIYRYALDAKFRFLSYGDGCLLFGQSLGQVS
jgi:S-adenosylmethionine:tRNA ribosyltransferase-isomerase